MDADVVGTKGWVTVTSADHTRTLGAHNKKAFGLCLKRDDTALRTDEQIRIRDLQL